MPALELPAGVRAAAGWGEVPPAWMSARMATPGSPIPALAACPRARSVSGKGVQQDGKLLHAIGYGMFAPVHVSYLNVCDGCMHRWHWRVPHTSEARPP